MTRIAVINDDTAFLELMQDLLTDVGYDVALYKEGVAAHQQVLQNPPHLIILDVRIERPDSGWQVLEMLRLHPESSTIPVIVCSADVIQLRSKIDMLRAQGYDTLEKPFDLDTLLDMVNEKIGPADRRQDTV
jgi:DNA-binding response OmpR family regulator